ncbi:uncharacterized protein [Haliotis asinina]|uniref:uncharacterized protein n=1 Tax=Haliotis asinina TaxID=109174 RepID=UPI0035323825
MYKREFFILGVIFCHPLSVVPSCDRRSFQRYGSLDGLLFNDTFVSESVVEERISCGERCHHHPLCNMLLYNPTSKRCRLYKSFVNTRGTDDTGWQYYAADCDHFRLENALSLSVVNQTVDVVCRSGFTYSPSSRFSSQCSLGTGVLNIGKCALTLFWTDPASPFVTDLPEPLYRGVEMTVRGSGNGVGHTDLLLHSSDKDDIVPFLLSIRWPTRQAFFNTKSGDWDTEIYASSFIFTPNVVFDVLVRITENHFLILIDGNDFIRAPVVVPVEGPVTLDVRFSRIKSVEVKYM